MTWCPLLCYPLSPSPVNIERFFKLGAKFCRKKFSSQALNCFLRLVHTASSFATGQKELMFQRKKSQCLRMKIWMISTLASLLPLHPPRQVQGLPELIGCQSHPPCKMVKQVNWGKRKTLESVAVDYHFRYLKIEHFTYINVPKIYIILHCFWKCLCYIHARKTRKETVQCHISDFCLRIGLT